MKQDCLCPRPLCLVPCGPLWSLLDLVATRKRPARGTQRSNAGHLRTASAGWQVIGPDAPPEKRSAWEATVAMIRPVLAAATKGPSRLEGRWLGGQHDTGG